MKTKFLWAVVALVVVGGLWAWSAHRTTPATGNPIKIGALISETGAAASFGEPAKNAIHLAVDEINENGGINGRLVEVYFEDDHTNGAEAVSAFQKLTSVEHVDGIVGGLFDFTIQPVFPLADQNKIALISPTNFHIPGGFDLTSNTFVMLPDFSTVIRELTGFLVANHTKKLAIVRFESVFGSEISKTLDAVMREQGQSPIIDETYKQIGGNDFHTIVLKLKSAGVDTVFLDMVDVDPVNFISTAKELNYHPTIVSYASFVNSFTLPGKDNASVEGTVILDWEQGSLDFTTKYKARYGIEPTHSANKSYMAVYALAEAIGATGDHTQVAPYLESHAIATPEGTLQFNKNHSVDSTLTKVQVIKDGLLVEWSAQ